MDTSISFRVTGRVQGVGFRAFIQRTGQQLGLSGWVKNNADGSVSGLAEGEQGLLVEFMKQVKIGNRWSSVDGLEEQPLRYSGEFSGFEIRY
ncbi:MAG: acylphosphatase [Candidatus Marinimicrobia bacterium]|nr:acylphosphatase [Candidatus Neomarinimicrobiota bacterium]